MEKSKVVEVVLPLTHESLIFKFIEPYTNEWVQLPIEVRKLIVKHPELFSLDNEKSGCVPRLRHLDVTFRHDALHHVWVIDSIVLPEIRCPF